MSNQEIRARRDSEDRGKQQELVFVDNYLINEDMASKDSFVSAAATSARNEFDPTQATFEEFMFSILMNS